jgi:hypothetical protein
MSDFGSDLDRTIGLQQPENRGSFSRSLAGAGQARLGCPMRWKMTSRRSEEPFGRLRAVSEVEPRGLRYMWVGLNCLAGLDNVREPLMPRKDWR